MDADIKPNRVFEDRLGKLYVLAVVNHWVMYTRGDGMKPEVISTQDLRRQLALDVLPAQPVIRY